MELSRSPPDSCMTGYSYRTSGEISALICGPNNIKTVTDMRKRTKIEIVTIPDILFGVQLVQFCLKLFYLLEGLLSVLTEVFPVGIHKNEIGGMRFLECLPPEWIVCHTVIR